MSEFRSGFVSIMGSPNVGKSTLMNNLLGQKISIVTHKAQTTRNTITGILTRKSYQIIFLDTPGIHTPKNKLGDFMVNTAYNANKDVDVTLMLIDAQVGLGERDREIIEHLGDSNILVVINKIDIVSESDLEKLTAKITELGIPKKNIMPISALKDKGIQALEDKIVSFLPEGPMFYPEDMVTDRPEKFIASEIIREKALLNLRDEIPHGIGVEVEQFRDGKGLLEIHAVIICERESHKGIIIGKGGSMLKKIGSDSRFDLQLAFNKKVFLQLFVKIREDWRNTNSVLKELGYRENND